MTTTSLLPHKPPLKTRNPVFLRTTYYGSVGRPSNGRRKSAVELLQETKAFYVKSESVLDTKQELKHTDHLHVRSPTVGGGGGTGSGGDLTISGSHTFHRSSPGNGGPVIPHYPFFPMGTCPPYPHHHFENYEHVHLQREFEHFVQQHVNKERKDNSSYVINENPSSGNNTMGSGGGNNKSRSQSTKMNSTRRSTLPPGTLQLHIQMQKDIKNVAGNHIIGLPLPFSTIQSQQQQSQQQQPISSTSPRQIDKHVSASLPTVITSSSSTLPNHGSVDKLDDNPPPLPPKSPRTTSKPVRPQDFPQRLPVQGMPAEIVPPPRRLMSHEGDHSHQDRESNIIHSKLRRLLHEGPGGITTVVVSSGTGDSSLVPITLPSPILPPTPPPDIAMESPMSDSGPILSPPPAFWNETLDVTTNGLSKLMKPPQPENLPPPPPLLDRQNSSASEKSSQKQKHPPPPLPMTHSTVSVSSISSRNSRKSVPEIPDISMRYSPRSQSSSSPMSPDDAADGDEEDDESSSSVNPPPISKKKLSNTSSNGSSQPQSKKAPIPKSVTENAICKLANTPPRLSSHSNEVSPNRRPILRSKSDLSHRYIKSGSSSNLLTGGFTLVHVDLGQPPPLPPHQNNNHNGPHYHQSSKQSQQPPTSAIIDAFNSNRESPNLGKRNSKSSLELERFFDKLGLDNTPPPPTLPPPNSNNKGGGQTSGGSSPVFFSSVSSVDSGPRRGGSIDSGDSPLCGVKVGSRTVGGGGYNAPVASSSSIVIHHGEPSIVERNARVIKWLFNCRKAVDKR